MLHHMLRAAAQRAFNVLDPYFQYVTMLLHGNGTNGAQNNTFVDSSTNNFTITRNGNTTQGTFTPYGSNWSNYFNGSSDYLTVASNAAFQFSTGDFTIELWFFMSSLTGGNQHLIDMRGASSTALAPLLYVTSGGVLYYYTAGTNQITGATLSVGQWYHIALARSGTSTKLFVNGTQSGSTLSDSTNYIQSSVYLGRASDAAGGYVNGYESNVRLVKGTAVYTTTFTPSTTPLTAITNTSLLTCQSNRFIDNSSNAFAITVNSTPSVQRFSPFNPTTAYSTSVIGGSGYFDGSGDYLTTNYTINWSTYGSYTLEFWVYHTTMSPTNQMYFAGGTGGTGNTIFYNYSSGKIGLGINGVNEIASATGVIKANTWQHIAYTFNGTTTIIYVDGVQVASGITAVYAVGSVALAVGGGSASSSFVMNGYIANMRLSQSVIYSSAFTPPTSPVTGGALLLNYTNAGILDNAMMNDLETVGNAQISTSVKKYGTGSMYFDGTGDYLKDVTSPVITLSGNFTIECWLYFNTVASAQPIISYGTSGSATNLLFLYNTSVGLRWYYANGAVDINQGSTSGWATGTWYHVAAVRSGSTLTLYRNGTSIASGTTTQTYQTGAQLNIGGSPGDSVYLNGYIDDFRITNGVARYTANFTPPTAAFPNN